MTYERGGDASPIECAVPARVEKNVGPSGLKRGGLAIAGLFRLIWEGILVFAECIETAVLEVVSLA
jgi:hypothetical protein